MKISSVFPYFQYFLKFQDRWNFADVFGTPRSRDDFQVQIRNFIFRRSGRKNYQLEHCGELIGFQLEFKLKVGRKIEGDGRTSELDSQVEYFERPLV